MSRWASNAVVALMTIFVFVIPFRFNTAIQEISFYTALFLAISLHTFKKKTITLQSPLTISFALLVVWAFIGLFFALNKENSVHDFYAHLLKHIMLFFLLINFFQTKKQFLLLVWSIVASMILFSVVAVIHFYLIMGNPLSARLLYVNIPVNIISVIAIPSLLLAFHQLLKTPYLYEKIILIVGIIVVASTILLTASRFTVATTLLCLLILCANNSPKTLLIPILIILMISFLPVKERFINGNIIKEVPQQERLRLSYPFIEMVKDYPITGVGFGMSTYAGGKLVERYNAKLSPLDRQDHPMPYPHNTFLDIAVRLGVVGLLIFFYIAFNYFRAGWRIMRNSQDDFLKGWVFCLMVSFLALLMIGMFESFLGFSVSIVLYIQCAMMVILWRIYSELPLQVGNNTSPQ